MEEQLKKILAIILFISMVSLPVIWHEFNACISTKYGAKSAGINKIYMDMYTLDCELKDVKIYDDVKFSVEKGSNTDAILQFLKESGYEINLKETDNSNVEIKTICRQYKKEHNFRYWVQMGDYIREQMEKNGYEWK